MATTSKVLFLVSTLVVVSLRDIAPMKVTTTTTKVRIENYSVDLGCGGGHFSLPQVAPDCLRYRVY